MRNEQFKAIIPPSNPDNPELHVSQPKEIERPSNEKPIIETETIVSFMGVEVKKGNGGVRTPDRKVLEEKTFTKFDLKNFRDIAIGLLMKQPVLLEGGAGVGKTKTIEMMCAFLNREFYKIPCNNMLPEELLGKTDFDMFDEEHARPAYEDEQEIIRTGQAIIDKVEKEVLPDGRINYVNTTKMPLLDEDGNIIGTFGISKNVTNFINMENELQAKNKIIQEKDEEIRVLKEELKRLKSKK